MVVATPRSAARRVALRALLLAGAAAGVAGAGALHLPRPATLCPLRAATGVPCPLCGTTTALARAGALDPGGALAANPLAVVALTALVLAPAAPVGLPDRVRRRPGWVVAIMATLVLAAWSWQLARHGLLFP